MHLELQKALIVVASCLLMASCTHVGQRLLTFEVEVDGTVEFTGIRGVRDDMPVAEMWDELADLEFDATTAPADATATTQELNGTIVVRIKHGNSALANAEVSSLTMEKAPSGLWVLPAGELDRIAAAAEQ